jgi:hypothetical protein
VRTNFGHQFHTPKQEQVSISTCVRKILICELVLKEYIHNRCSKCLPCDTMYTSTRLIMDRHIRAKMSRQLRIVWQTSAIRWWSASSLSTGAAFWCPHRQKSRIEIWRGAWRPCSGTWTCPSVMTGVTENISYSTAQMCRSTIMHVPHWCSAASGTASSSYDRSRKRKSR